MNTDYDLFAAQAEHDAAVAAIERNETALEVVAHVDSGITTAEVAEVLEAAADLLEEDNAPRGVILWLRGER